jgi:hypothetical protein
VGPREVGRTSRLEMALRIFEVGKGAMAGRVIRRIASPEETGNSNCDLQLPDPEYGREVGTKSKSKKRKYVRVEDEDEDEAQLILVLVLCFAQTGQTPQFIAG